MIKIYGASDDLIEIDGDVYEEFGYDEGPNDHGSLVHTSTGHVFRIKFGEGWQIRCLHGDDTQLTREQVDRHGDGDLDDVITINADVAWVVCGHEIAKARTRT